MILDTLMDVKYTSVGGGINLINSFYALSPKDNRIFGCDV